MKKFCALIVIIVIFVLATGCGNEDRGNSDDNDAVPEGDPPFPALTNTWVIDTAGVMDKKKIGESHIICQKLQDDGVAEMVVLIRNGVQHPADYATHYGRAIKLGKKGPATEGGQNGIVWLIRPDAQEKMTYSIGRGLPKLTSNHLVEIMEKVKEYLNFNNYDTGILILVQETDKKVRELYGKKGETK